MKKIILSFAFLHLIYTSQGQLLSSVYPEDGTMITLKDCHNTDPLADVIGSDVIWDFSDIPGCDTDWELTFLSADGSPDAAYFYEANKYIEIVIDEDTILYYNNLNETSLDIVGIKHGYFDPPFYLKHSGGESILKFPLEINDTWFNTYSIPTNMDTLHSSSTFVVDGYGTLILPNATYNNVYRIHSIRPDVALFTEETYTYYSPDYQYHLMHMLVDDETQYQTDPTSLTSGIKDVIEVKKVKTSPNPALDLNNIQIEFDSKKEVDLFLFSRFGEVLISKKGIRFSDGRYNLNSNNNMNSGVYFIQVIEGNKVYNSMITIL